MKAKYAALVLLLASSVYATPVFFDNVPVDGSFYGKGVINFSVNITSASLNSGGVRLFVISEDAYSNNEPWDNYTLSCVQYVADNWKCTRTLSFAVAGSDTLEFFYFSAEDSGGNSTSGSPSSPLQFRIDRTGPAIAYNSPQNNSYVAGSVNVSVSVSDTVSGINISYLSVDGGPWIQMPGSYVVDTTAYPNNHTLSLRVNSTDNVGNPSVSTTIVFTDNKKPEISISKPVPGEKLAGTKQLSVNVSDSFSGVSSAGFSIAGGQTTMNCSGTAHILTCTHNLNTLAYSDGNLTIIFYAYDNASNMNSSNVTVAIKNSLPSIAVVPSGFMGGTVAINATISNPDGAITAVVLNIEGPTSVNVTMGCTPGFTSCSYSLDSASFAEGSYTLLANASNVLGSSITGSSAAVIDNTKPNLTVDIPAVVKELATVNSEVTDANHDSGNVVFSLLGNKYGMTCLPQDNRLLCYLNFNFSSTADGLYNVTVTATDRANNVVSKVTQIVADKYPPELSYVTIEPINPSVTAGVSISAALSDAGSSVKQTTAVLRSDKENFTLTLGLENGLWKQVFYAGISGSYEVDIEAEDLNGNVKNFSKVGYFFMGQLSCGDGVCQSNENYCLCAKDCTAPKCSGNTVVSCSSGIPQCAMFAACGDKVCTAGETCGNCPGDCGSCSGSVPVNSSTVVITEGGAEVADMFAGIYDIAGGNLPVIIASLVIICIGTIVFLMKRRRSSQ